MKWIFTTIFCCLFLITKAQIKDSLDDKIHGMTTIVKTELLNHTLKATGFFYLVFDSVRQNHWAKIKEIWLITNRHAVVFKDTYNKEHLANKLTFYLRYVNKHDSLYWSPVVIDHQLLKRSARFLKDSTVDVIAIPIIHLFNKAAMNTDISRLFGGVSEDMFPNRDSTMTPQVSDDIIVVGYPADFYDQRYLFPIVKTGIIASRWGLGFDGRPYFLIDSKLFPQSSGSLVLSKPSNYMVKNGEMEYSPNKQFVFLGIYSGEPIRLDTNNDSKINIENYDLGVVWYYTTVLDVIKHGTLWNN